ncbi:MAG: DUF4332 domain-containing protein [Deltaproteobacteria bacterium]|nr:DUF4332 domain-containing protein [Deltaproteobacteria bacterium]
MKRKIKVHGPLGILIFILAAVMLGQGREPFATYFYSFAWWSYILAADAMVYWMRGESLIVNRTRTFLLMIPLSIFIWCIFEGFNFKLANWHYITVPQELWKRWIGYAVAYGTVLPGLCETYHLFKAARLFRSASIKRRRLTSQFLQITGAVGIISLVSSLLLPRYCFPLVWIGFALLIEPFLYRFGDDSLLRDMEKGELTRLLTLLAAGLVCGFLWESWNFWAQTKWIYTVPFFERWKLFEMPVLGFVGFPPFTVSAYAMYHMLLVAMRRRKAWMRVILWSAIAIFCLSCFAGIDHYTVVSYIPEVRDLPGVQVEWKERLRDAGIKKVQDLIQKGAPHLVQLGIPQPEAEELIQKAEFITMKGIGLENYHLLQETGVENISMLSRQDPGNLYVRLQEINRRLHLTRCPPAPAIVRLWVREAQKKVK